MLVAVVGGTAAVAATLLPWGQFGDIEVRLYELPGWLLHVVAAAGQQLCVVAGLVSDRRGSRAAAATAGLAFGVATVVTTIVFMSTSQDPAVVFGPGVVPAITPVLSSGCPVALAGAVISAAASVLTTRSSGPRRLDHHRWGRQPISPPGQALLSRQLSRVRPDHPYRRILDFDHQSRSGVETR